MKRVCGALLLALAVGPVIAQDRDFLTSNEADPVREAQEPNDRVKLYIYFARQRLDLLEQALAADKPGRSGLIHDVLEDYSRIIEAIDSVADDALRRKVAIDKGMVLVASAEKEFLDKLNKIEPSEPRDLSRYQFVLDQAIDTTSDSLELSQVDATKRAGELAAHDAKEKKTRESMMSTKEVGERKKAEKEEQEKKKKAPTLYRPGEKPPQQ